MSVPPPEVIRDLVEGPHFCHLGTVRPDGSPQVNPMWFEWDGEFIKMTHTTKRGKWRNLQANPHVSVCFPDPAQPYRYVEMRGVLDHTEPDPAGEYYVHLSTLYGPAVDPPPDRADRVVLYLRPQHWSGHMTPRDREE